MPQPWVRLSVTFYTDPRVAKLSPHAELLYVRAIAWCAAERTDGRIPRAALGAIGARIPRYAQVTREIVDAGLWSDAGDGWRFPLKTWKRWQLTNAQRDAKRAGTAARMRAYRDRKRDASRYASPEEALRVTPASRDALVTRLELEKNYVTTTEPSYGTGAPGSVVLEDPERINPAAALDAMKKDWGNERNGSGPDH